MYPFVGILIKNLLSVTQTIYNIYFVSNTFQSVYLFCYISNSIPRVIICYYQLFQFLSFIHVHQFLSTIFHSFHSCAYMYSSISYKGCVICSFPLAFVPYVTFVQLMYVVVTLELNLGTKYVHVGHMHGIIFLQLFLRDELCE